MFRYIFAPNFAFFQFDEGRNDYDGKFEMKEMSGWIHGNSLALVNEFTQEVRWLRFEFRALLYHSTAEESELGERWEIGRF